MINTISGTYGTRIVKFDLDGIDLSDNNDVNTIDIKEKILQACIDIGNFTIDGCGCNIIGINIIGINVIGDNELEVTYVTQLSCTEEE